MHASDGSLLSGEGDPTKAAPLAVYVHFPWCLEKCPYCDFVSFKTTRDAVDHEGYADAVIAELTARAAWLAGRRVSSIFIGGGTPSLWAPRAIARVVSAIFQAFPPLRREDVEITFECNPTSLGEDDVQRLLEAGANRLSVGIQSLDDRQLQYLGRLHDVALGTSALRAAIAHAPRVSADLIFALPDQRPEDAAAHAARLVDMGLSHLSAYALTIEDGTRFGELQRRGKLPLATDDATADAFLAIESAMAERGLSHYEVSNYARPGQESRHNMSYWRGHDYVGLGTAAYGFATIARDERGESRAIRYRNQPDPKLYVDGCRNIVHGEPNLGDRVTSTVERLDAETLMRERIMLGLRIAEGVDLDRAARELGLPRDKVWTDARQKTLQRLVARGDVVAEGSVVRMAAGRRLATDGVAMRLF